MCIKKKSFQTKARYFPKDSQLPSESRAVGYSKSAEKFSSLLPKANELKGNYIRANLVAGDRDVELSKYLIPFFVTNLKNRYC